MALSSFYPTPNYPHLYLSRYIYLTRLVHDDVHPFDHRLLQPLLRLLGLVGVTLDDHLIVADKHRDGPGALAPSLPKGGERQLQTIICSSLDRSVEAVCQPVDVHTTSAREGPGLGFTKPPGSLFTIVPPPQAGVGLEETPAVEGGFL